MLRPGQAGSQALVELGLSVGGVFGLQTLSDLVQQRRSPAALEQLFRCHLLSRLQTVTVFGAQFIPGKQPFATAAFAGLTAFPFVDEEMIQRGQQVGPKPSAVRRDASREILL